MPDALGKLDNVKRALNFSGTKHDAALTDYLEAATSTAAALIGVSSLMRETDVIEYPRATRYGTRRVLLSRYPVESVSVLKLAGYTSDSDGFSELTSLTPDVDFLVGRDYGAVELFHGELFSTYIQANLIVYTAGWIDPAEADPPATALRAPAFLQQAIEVETVRLWNTRDQAGVDQVNAGKGEGFKADQGDVHEQLRMACKRLRRVTL